MSLLFYFLQTCYFTQLSCAVRIITWKCMIIFPELPGSLESGSGWETSLLGIIFSFVTRFICGLLRCPTNTRCKSPHSPHNPLHSFCHCCAPHPLTDGICSKSMGTISSGKSNCTPSTCRGFSFPPFFTPFSSSNFVIPEHTHSKSGCCGDWPGNGRGLPLSLNRGSVHSCCNSSFYW